MSPYDRTLHLVLAAKYGTLRIEERHTRFRNQIAFYLSDGNGLVDICLTQEELDARLAQVHRMAGTLQ